MMYQPRISASISSAHEVTRSAGHWNRKLRTRKGARKAGMMFSHEAGKRAANSVHSPPPSGEGLGWGRSGATDVCNNYPLPTPPPQGGREPTEYVARADFRRQKMIY